MPESNAEGDDCHDEQQAQCDDVIDQRRPAQQRDHQQFGQYANREVPKDQTALDEQEQPDDTQADHHRPADKALLAYAFDQMGHSESDQAECQQIGGPAEEGDEKFIERLQDGSRTEDRKRRRQQER